MYVHLKKHRLRETGLGRTAGPVFVLNGGNMKTEIRGIRLARLLLFWFAGNLTAFFAVGWKILIGILTGIAFLFFQFFHPHTVAGEKKLASLEHGCNLLRTGAVWLVLECVTVGILIWSHALFWALELVNLGVGNRVPRTFTYCTPFFAGKAAVAHCLVFPVVDACTELVSHCTYLSYCKT